MLIIVVFVIEYSSLAELKNGFRTFMVTSHKLWALLYSSHDEMNSKENKSYFLVSYYM